MSNWFEKLIGVSSVVARMAQEYGAAVDKAGKHFVLLEYPEYEPQTEYDEENDFYSGSFETKTAMAFCLEDKCRYVLDWGRKATDNGEAVGDEYGNGPMIFVYSDVPTAVAL